MSIERVLVFSSVDAKKQNVRFDPELQLDVNKPYFLALSHASMTASWFNIRPEYNNVLKFSKDDGKTWQDIRFLNGIYDYDDIGAFIKSETRTVGGGSDAYGIELEFDLSLYKVYITLHLNYQIDFANSGEFRNLLGFDKKKY